jgi:hypothetical protein
MKFRKKRALITGASSGIGYELARLFARDGYDLTLVADDCSGLLTTRNKIEKEYGETATIIVADLSLPGAAKWVFENCELHEDIPDILVNNAGMGSWGPFSDSDPEVQSKMIMLNVVTLTQMTRLFLPGMISRRHGKILNVASTGSFQPGPLMAVYYATKAYVLSFSEAVGNELKGTGVSVTALCPGPTVTEFHRRAGIKLIKFFGGRVTMAMSADKVARKGYRALMRGKPVVIPGIFNKMQVFSLRFLPRRAVTGILRAVQEIRRRSP